MMGGSKTLKNSPLVKLQMRKIDAFIHALIPDSTSIYVKEAYSGKW